MKGLLLLLLFGFISVASTAQTVTIKKVELNSCAGDSATDGYRVNTFMVPASVDVSQLQYNAGGPIAPAGVTFKFPLFAQTGNAQQVNRNTAPTTGIITAGNLLQPFSFAALVAGGIEVPNGSYKVGLACTLLGVTEEYW